MYASIITTKSPKNALKCNNWAVCLSNRDTMMVSGRERCYF